MLYLTSKWNEWGVKINQNIPMIGANPQHKMQLVNIAFPSLTPKENEWVVQTNQNILIGRGCSHDLVCNLRAIDCFWVPCKPRYLTKYSWLVNLTYCPQQQTWDWGPHRGTNHWHSLSTRVHNVWPLASMAKALTGSSYKMFPIVTWPRGRVALIFATTNLATYSSF